MPVPASESADGLQTPEVFSQNELYGLFDSKMDPNFGPDFLASFAGESTTTTMPRGSDLGANPSSKFDLEPTADINLDVKASASSNSPNFNVDDFFNDLLPLSSEEMNSLCNTADVGADCSNIRLPVEEQCDTSAPVCGAPSASSSSVWFDGNAKITAVHQPVTDKYSQFDVNRAVHKTAETGEIKPDIVQSALFQSAALENNDCSGTITAEELAEAQFIFVTGNNNDPALNQFITIDHSSLLQLDNGDPNNDNNNNAAFIPLPVEQAANSSAASATTALAATSSSNAFITIDVPKSEADLDAEMDAADTTTSAAAPSTSRGAKKRKFAPSVADEGDDDSLADGDTLDYKEKRRRNNIAVRKSRALAKEKQKNTEAENEMLRMDNEKKSREIEILQREIKIYKELFEKSGFALPRK